METTLTPGSVALETPWPEDGCPLCGIADDGRVLYCDHLQLLHDRAGLADDEITGIDMGDSCARCGDSLWGVKIVYCNDCWDNFPDEVEVLEVAGRQRLEQSAREQDALRAAGKLPPLPAAASERGDPIPF